MRKFLPVVLSCLFLSACGSEQLLATSAGTNIAMGGITAVSYSVVGQGPVDYIMSRSQHKYCDFRNLKPYGEYCIDKNDTTVDPAIYCYRTIGTPDCTDMIDPHNNGDQPIVGPGHLPMNATPVAASYTPPPDYTAPTPLLHSTGGLTDADANLKPAHDTSAPSPAETDPVKRGDFK